MLSALVRFPSTVATRQGEDPTKGFLASTGSRLAKAQQPTPRTNPLPFAREATWAAHHHRGYQVVRQIHMFTKFTHRYPGQNSLAILPLLRWDCSRVGRHSDRATRHLTKEPCFEARKTV